MCSLWKKGWIASTCHLFKCYAKPHLDATNRCRSDVDAQTNADEAYDADDGEYSRKHKINCITISCTFLLFCHYKKGCNYINYNK